METQTHIITFSRTAMILKCCGIALVIACLFSLAGKINAHEFVHNLLDWDSI